MELAMPPTTTLDLPCGLPIQSTRDRQFYDRECAKRCCMKKPAEPAGASAKLNGLFNVKLWLDGMPPVKVIAL